MESVGEQVYFTRLSNGLTIHLIPKEDYYYETYGIITTKFGLSGYTNSSEWG